MIDDIILSPILGPSGSGLLFFEPEIRNDIVIQFSGTETGRNGHFLYDIEFLDEAGIYATRIINVDLTRQCYQYFEP